MSETITREEYRAQLRAKYLADRSEKELRDRYYVLVESADGSVENLVERLEIRIALDGFRSDGPSDAALHRLGEHLATVEQ